MLWSDKVMPFGALCGFQIQIDVCVENQIRVATLLKVFTLFHMSNAQVFRILSENMKNTSVFELK